MAWPSSAHISSLAGRMLPKPSPDLRAAPTGRLPVVLLEAKTPVAWPLPSPGTPPSQALASRLPRLPGNPWVPWRVGAVASPPGMPFLQRPGQPQHILCRNSQGTGLGQPSRFQNALSFFHPELEVCVEAQRCFSAPALPWPGKPGHTGWKSEVFPSETLSPQALRSAAFSAMEARCHQVAPSTLT